VNKSGQFNVPYGHTKTPKIIECGSPKRSSAIFCNTRTHLWWLQSSFKKRSGNQVTSFILIPLLQFLSYADFNVHRSFNEEIILSSAAEVSPSAWTGCHVVLTNSNPFVHEHYSKFNIKSSANKAIYLMHWERPWGGLIITIPPNHTSIFRLVPSPLPRQTMKYRRPFYGFKK